MDAKSQLSSLSEFMRDVFTRTEEVKATLQSECNEAMFVLKPWHMESFTTKKVTEDMCTCKEVTLKSQTEEIAAGISKALLQTQQLREKLSLNAVKKKKRDVENIYAPQSIAKSTVKKVPQIHQDKEPPKPVSKSNIKYRKSCESLNTLGVSKPPTVKDLEKKIVSKSYQYGDYLSASKSTVCPKVQREISDQQIESPDKLAKHSSPRKNVQENKSGNLEQATSATKCLKSFEKSKKEKNFLLANKLYVKTIKHPNSRDKDKLIPNIKIGKEKSVQRDAECNQTPNKSAFKKAASTTELQNLIKKMSLDSSEFASVRDTDNCPVHGNNVSEFVEERSITTLDVIEALDRFGVPGEIVKVLKVYHSYLKSEFSNEVINNKRRQKSINKFLSGIDERTNNVDQKSDSHMVNLTRKSVSLFHDVFETKMSPKHLDNIRTRYAELSSICKAHDIEKCDVIRFKKPDVQNRIPNNFLKRQNWICNGIWNDQCITNFEGMSKVCCIRYSDDNQLLSFFEMTQRLQQAQYFKSLIDIILQRVIPAANRCFDVSSDEYAQLYKMIVMLSQGLNPKIPVLVRTDK